MVHVGVKRLVTPSDTATPRLLVATSSSRLYFEPNDDFSGSITDAITFRAWDRTDSGWGQLGSDINGESSERPFRLIPSRSPLTARL